MKPTLTLLILLLASLSTSALAQSGQREAPPGMFKDLDEVILGDAIVIEGKQLFIDDYSIGEMQGLKKQLNPPTKHPQNPIIRRDRPSDGLQIDYGSVAYDPRSKKFQLWYQVILGKNFHEHHTHQYLVAYAVSDDGVTWTKPVLNETTVANLVTIHPPEPFIAGPGVMIDERDPNPDRRYKMLYSAKPDGKASSLAVHAAYSADGIHWKQEPKNPLIPYSDTQIAPYWDARRERYVAYLRFGPPNIRLSSRIESEDFRHWSPKVTVVGDRGLPQDGVAPAVNQAGAAKKMKKSKLDEPFSTEFYGMVAMPYAGIYLGLLNTYHGETIQPIPGDKPWMDRVNNQLVISRNGLTWQRVIASGALTSAELRSDRDWRTTAEEAVFLPYGTAENDWDWGQVYPHQPPLVVGDEIRIYYGGTRGRHWATYHKDPIESGVGLATLRLDGFVSVNAGNEPGTLTTKPLVFIGDTLEINANAAGGSLTVEALDATGKVIAGFGSADCTPITTDSVRHVVRWKDNPDCHLLQARPIRLRFHLKNARLYGFEPRIRHNHYLQFRD